MRRRKRKMRSSLLVSPHLTSRADHLSTRRPTIGLLFILASALGCLSMLQPHLVNPTTQLDGGAGGSNQTPGHFDDEPNFHRELSDIRRLQAAVAQRSINETKMKGPPETAPQLLPVIKSQDHLDGRADERDDVKEQQQHLGDLLAVESSRSPAAVGAQLLTSQRLHQQAAFVAPYEANGPRAPQELAAPRFQNLSSSASKQRPESANGSSLSGRHMKTNSDSTHNAPTGATQLLRLQPHASAPLEPIYLKHNLPDAAERRAPLTRPPIVALSHPSHTSAGSFALVPSWPNIYIAQRERVAQPHGPPLPSAVAPAVSPSRDPKVPVKLPEWSRGSNYEAEHEQVEEEERETAHKSSNQRANDEHVQQQQQQQQHQQQQQQQVKLTSGRGGNLTASEVEYEREDEPGAKPGQDYDQSRLFFGGHNESTDEINNNNNYSDDNDNNNNDNNNNFTSKPPAGGSRAQWSELLQQAAKSQGMKSLMFTNRSIISLTCDTQDMLVGIKFKQPFYGSVETNLDPTRACRIFGNGSHYYEMRIGLLECGTRQEMPRLFINNIQIIFRSNNSKRQQALDFFDDQDQRQRLRQAAARASGGGGGGQLRSAQLRDSGQQLFLDLEARDELKTLVCSYPPAHPTLPLSDSPERDRSRPTLNSQPNSQHASDLTPTRPNSIAFGRNTSPSGGSQLQPEGGGGGGGGGADDLNSATTTSGRRADNKSNQKADLINLLRKPSDRLIDATNIDDPPPPGTARPLYYEPILLISGLILLALALTLALVSSAYLARRHQRQSQLNSQSTSRPAQSAVASNNFIVNTARGDGGSSDDDELRAYTISPSQLANRRSGLGSPSLIAPPLIGLTKEDLLTTRPSEKRYSTTTQKELKRLRDRHQQVPTGTSAAHSARSRGSEHSSSSRSTGTGDSLESGAGKTESATTIEIPPLARYREQQVTPRNTGGERKEPPPPLTRPVSATKATGKAGASGARAQTAQQVPTPTSPSATGEEIYKRETSLERIVETTSYTRRRSGTPGTAPPSAIKHEQQKQRLAKNQSPLPFGSFRSKLTSPHEYRRLQNISRLFGDSLLPTQNDALFDKYRNKIARTMSDRERLELRKLFQQDEVFRSNVVDSIDAETFARKLHDNPKYSQSFSQRSWNLLRDIALDPDIMGSEPLSRLGSSATTRPGSTKLEELFTQSPAGTRSRVVGHDQTASSGREMASSSLAAEQRARREPQVTNLDESKYWRPIVGEPADERAAARASTSQQTGKREQGARQEEAQKSAPVKPPGQITRDAQATAASSKSSHLRQAAAGATTSKMVRSNEDVVQRAHGDRNDKPPTAVRISQSNSARTRRDGGTTINIDSVTNISAPRSFSALTRSSFEQVTKYQEDDSLPYMDEFSQCSMDGDRRSLSSSSLDDGGGGADKSAKIHEKKV